MMTACTDWFDSDLAPYTPPDAAQPPKDAQSPPDGQASTDGETSPPDTGTDSGPVDSGGTDAAGKDAALDAGADAIEDASDAG